MDALPENPGAAMARETRAAHCPEHGAYLSRNIMRKVWSRCEACQQEANAAEQRQRDAERAKADEDRHRRMLDATRIPPRFERCEFASFTADTAAMRHALTVLREYAENFDEMARRGASLVLAGKPGTGKSHLAGAVLRALMDGRSVRYITCLDMIRAVRETWRRESSRTEAALLDYLGGLDLLVIDELGMQYGTEGEQTIIFDVLDRRYRDMRPVILITNQNSDGLKAFVGDRVFDRLRETARWVTFDWESHRSIARKAAAWPQTTDTHRSHQAAERHQ